MESFRPRMRFLTSISLMFLPVLVESLIETMRSPARMPARSAGPPGMISITLMVSFISINDMPMPLNFPSRSSLA